MSRRMCVLMTALIFAGGASAAELNLLSDLKVFPTSSGAQVVVAGNRAPTFTVFRLNEPDRLVVDLSSADASAVKGHHAGAGPISGVVASQFTDGQSSVGRVLVALGTASKYDVKADGNRVIVSVEGGSVPAQAGPALSKSPPAQSGPADAPPPEALSAEAAPPRGPDNVVASESDEREVKAPARRITSLRLAQNRLRVRTDGEIAKYDLVELADPPRLALDLYSVKLETKVPKVRSAAIKEIRAGAHADKVRLVMDMRGSMPAYRALRTRRGMDLVFSDKPALARLRTVESGSQEAEAEIDGKKLELGPPEPAQPPRASTAVSAKAAHPVEINDLTFNEAPGGGRIELKLSSAATFKVERPDERSAVLTLESARLPKRLERSLDTSALETPVKMISAFPVHGDTERVRVVVASSRPLEEKVEQTPHGLSWKLGSPAAAKNEEVAAAPKAAAATTDAPALAAPGLVHRTKYVGKKVSFEFKDIDIHNLLRVIAEVSKKNVIVADDVSGKVTIRLRNVPWDQALELILRSKNLGKEEMGNIIRVAPLKTLEEEAKLREERRKSQMRQEELVVQLIPVNYATANDMSSRVKEVLSERGTVTVDTRTNVLIVRDIASNIARARSLVQNLDTQTPQVLIESRIVEANTTFSKQIGVQWGGSAQAAPGTGNPTGLAFPYTIVGRGGSAQTGGQGVADPPNFAVNLPAAVGQGSGGALGFTFGSAGGALILNLRLSALENQGFVKTISAPKVTTLDNEAAKISQGVSIPFSQVSAGGVNTTFIEARLSLEVTPHITQDGSILMKIRAENNQPDPSNTGANGQPAIQRKEAQTQVLVKDSDTTVIGGIYVRRGSNTVATVPFLGKIPILGFFFKNTLESDSRQELLIFITPRIINRQTIAQNP